MGHKAKYCRFQPSTKGDDELARRFDVLVLVYQIALLSGSQRTDQYMAKISRTAHALEKKGNIPQVAIHISLIKALQTDHFWESISLKKLEEVRVALRGLIKYLEKEKQGPIYTNFEDELDYDGIVISQPVEGSYISLQSYKDRVEKYVRDNINHVVIRKLSNNVPITPTELDELEKMLFTESVAGSKEDYIKEYGDKPLGAFIRSITGLDQSKVNEAFADFLQVGNLRADQMTFVKTIISYLTKNGTIDKRMLYEPPFTDLNDQGISGVFDNDGDVIKIVKILDGINGNAGMVS